MAGNSDWYNARRSHAGEYGPQLEPQSLRGWSAAISEEGVVMIGAKTLELQTTPGLPAACFASEDSRDSQGTGFVLWDASIALAWWIEANFEERFTTPDLQWVELGAGLGIPGMAAAVLGNRHGHNVVLTDLPALVPAIHDRLVANSIQNASAHEYVWGEAPMWTADCVLAADCCWHKEQVSLFVRALTLVTREHGTAFVCTQRRVEEVEKRLREALQAHFTIEDPAVQGPGIPLLDDLGGKLYLMICHRRRKS